MKWREYSTFWYQSKIILHPRRTDQGVRFTPFHSVVIQEDMRVLLLNPKRKDMRDQQSRTRERERRNRVPDWAFCRLLGLFRCAMPRWRRACIHIQLWKKSTFNPSAMGLRPMRRADDRSACGVTVTPCIPATTLTLASSRQHPCHYSSAWCISLLKYNINILYQKI